MLRKDKDNLLKERIRKNSTKHKLHCYIQLVNKTAPFESAKNTSLCLLLLLVAMTTDIKKDVC